MSAWDEPADAIRDAAAEHLIRPSGWNLWPADARRIVADVLETARPLIEADLRERLAAAIDALPPENATGSRDFGRGYVWATRDAARIVRERP